MREEPTESLQSQVNDFRTEARELMAFVEPLAEPAWHTKTTFKSWTVYDVVAHLHFTDHMGLTTIEGADAFRALMRDVGESGLNLAEYTRRWLGGAAPSDLFSRWRETAEALCYALERCNPAERLAWGGPGMRPRMFATARQMETWAHGWEIYDAFDAPRTHSDRLYNVAEIGVRTYAWTFVNRQIAPPEPQPFVELIAPSGATWCWGESTNASRVSGDAVEFCQVVTQVRNVADTNLNVAGESAERWMSIAQCFAGPPEEPPAPGTRASKTTS